MSFQRKYTDQEFDYYFKETEITSEDESFSNYAKLIHNKNIFNVHTVISTGTIYLKKQSLMKILKMSEGEPEEQILFSYYNPLSYDNFNDLSIGKASPSKNSDVPPNSQELIGVYDSEVKPKENVVREGLIEQITDNHVNNIQNSENNNVNDIRTNSLLTKILRILFLVYLVFAIIYIIYFIIKASSNEIMLFETFSLIAAVCYIGVGVVGFLLVNSEQKNYLPLILVIVSIIITLLDILFGVMQKPTNNEPNKPKETDKQAIFFIYILNIILGLYESIMLVLCLIKPTESPQKETLLDHNKEAINMSTSVESV